MNRLITGQWIRKRLNVLVTGPTGAGKTGYPVPWEACRDGFTVQYHRLFRELGYAHGDGRYPKVMKKRTDVIILADQAHRQRRELLDILEDRHRRRSTVVTISCPWSIGTK